MLKILAHLLISALILSAQAAPVYGAQSRIAGTVRDSNQAVVADADITLISPQQTVVATTRSDAQGRFAFANVPRGSYLLIISTRGFAELRVTVNARNAAAEDLELRLEPQGVTEQVTVTATAGLAETAESQPQTVTIINEREIAERAKAVVAQVAQEEAGLQLQRTSPTMSGIFIRGLTGNKVNVFVDGIRYTNSAQRGGVNTFLNLIEPSSLDSVEVLRGPNSAQYGSDAIGGSIQFLQGIPRYSATGSNVHGRSSIHFNSADLSFGSNLLTTFSTPTFGLLGNFAGRRVNTLRPGGGIDSHNAVRRYFELPSSVIIGDRLPDTAFTQYGGLIKASWTPSVNNQFIINYTRSQQDGGKRYDQLLGGDGNLVANLRNLMLDLFYVKYDRFRAGWFDSVMAAYSFNSQREERVNQGGNGNPLASINHEYERMNVHGMQLRGDKQLGERWTMMLGGEFYHERINSPSFAFSPASETFRIRRGRIPDNARFQSGGVYAQTVFDAVTDRLRLTANLRYSAAAYRARAIDSPIVNGERLWSDDSLRVDDFSFRVGAVWMPVEGLFVSGNVSRGFRAPHMTDLGTLGLTGSGFEVAAPDIAGLNAMIGTTADEDAVSTGLPVTQLVPETSYNYEIGARYRHRRFDTELVFFVNDIDDNIVKQTLILPQGAVGLTLGGQPIVAQNENGAVFVEASPNPVLVRANFDKARIYGFEQEFDLHITSNWMFTTIFTYLHARDRITGLPPNIEGGTPAPDGYIKLRYTSPSRRYWIEPYVHGALKQDRLSSLDATDRRTGAGRSRNSIANFFFNGATARGLISPGADGIFGTADDILIPTGETLAEVQARVLGPNGAASSLFPAVPGYVTLNVRGGMRFGERHEVMVDFENITDRNYRGISWGIDAPGRGVFMRYSTRF